MSDTVSEPRTWYILRIVNDGTRRIVNDGARPDAVWWIGPFDEEMAATAWAIDHVDGRSGDWQLLGLTAAEVSQPLRLIAPKDAAEQPRA
jgi:hypothetical protein